MGFRLRPYQPEDFDPLMALWVRTWNAAYPGIDFHERLDWWKQRWVNELLPVGEVTVALGTDNAPLGFLVITPATLYIDQLVVAPEAQGLGLGTQLIDYAKKRSGSELSLAVNQSNEKALRFYKSNGFSIMGESVNERSGMLTFDMLWRADQN